MIKSREGLRLSEKIHQEVISVQQEDEEIKINSAADNALCNRIDWFLLFPVNWLLLLSLSVSMTHTHCHTQTAKTVTHYLTLLSRSVYSLPALCSFLWPLKQIYRLRSRKQHWRKVSKGISREKESQRTFMSVSRSKIQRYRPRTRGNVAMCLTHGQPLQKHQKENGIRKLKGATTQGKNNNFILSE